MLENHKFHPGFLFAAGLLIMLSSCQTQGDQKVLPAPYRSPLPAGIEAPALDLDQLESTIQAQINNERRFAGLAAFEEDTSLISIARSHSNNMANQNFFSHRDPEGNLFEDRVKNAGYDCIRADDPHKSEMLAENIFDAMGYGITSTGTTLQYHWRPVEEIAASVVQGWMESPPHRANILHPQLKKSGIGAAVSSNQDIFVTLDFCGN